MPDEMYRLFNDKATTSSMNKIIKRWENSMKNKNTIEIKDKDRLREHKIVDFTLSNNEFTALGHTNLFTSSYGKIKKINGVYNVNITVLMYLFNIEILLMMWEIFWLQVHKKIHERN